MHGTYGTPSWPQLRLLSHGVQGAQQALLRGVERSPACVVRVVRGWQLVDGAGSRRYGERMYGTYSMRSWLQPCGSCHIAGTEPNRHRYEVPPIQGRRTCTTQ